MKRNYIKKLKLNPRQWNYKEGGKEIGSVLTNYF